ncbi:ras-related protein Rab-26 [Motacilla alba alba]|uniref:ras-related protein Rab-26 n=1 Tax=Motacilla alba alba TaxID=1094192 RepID=UPI0018D595B5|nr:ras-related protein Rab-26 [Motacilla alba alba]
MSRKKAARSKGGGAAPSAALPPAGQGTGRAAAAPRGSSAAAAAPELPRNGGAAAAGRPSLSSSGEFYDLAFKVMLVGDSGVGKTCLLVRFKDGAFLAGSFISTVGIDFRHFQGSRDSHSFSGLPVPGPHYPHREEFLPNIPSTPVLPGKSHSLRPVTAHPRPKSLSGSFQTASSPSQKQQLRVPSFPFARELKHRSMKLPNEPKFKLHDYVKKEVRGSGCCRS